MSVSESKKLLEAHKILHDVAVSLEKKCGRVCKDNKPCPFWNNEECIIDLLDGAMQIIEKIAYILEGKLKPRNLDGEK